MDKSLDDIIKAKPRNTRRSSRRGAKAGIVGSNAAAGAAARRATATVAAAKGVSTTGGTPSDKIIVSNLPIDVNEQQIKELFSSTIGPLREVTLHYDAHGKSKGLATVQFSRKGDGVKAHTQYNNRLIDGKRPMKIEIVMGPAPPPTLASRVAPAPNATAGVPATTAPRGAGRGRRGRGRRGAKSDRPSKTGEELDAEMEDYTKSETAAAGTTAAAAA